ncbi:aspartate/glutamate racemase family protein [Gordonia rubripertincta]|uniref:Maleate isomerase n=1 Tax=Gordonia rubripertincta TaxID=36822 RepID=A0AAW4G8L7_GORRU|nr:aspartate/glutamate racemase family protein [Gordonia rubripertincta]MBM7279508.1 aspartate/glutamate racemase family protein [Gordonia rubripertincta]QMU22913.1 aspartate/glutamate racemase family protein [Gordonia rubripertincta]
MTNNYRIGMIVPSSNTTMETEIPAMLRAREEIRPERFTFHSSRMRMKKVTPEELTAMDNDSLRCAAELADARVDVMAYACLVAIMSQGLRYHATAEPKLAQVAKDESGEDIPVLSSAGALTEALTHLGVKKIAVVTPYMKPLTATVCDYIAHEGFTVVDSLSLEVADNLEVGRLNPQNLIEHVTKVDTSDADALVLSACVQMPSLPVLDTVQQQFDIPVLSASAATTWRILNRLGLDPVVPRAGALLAP